MTRLACLAALVSLAACGDDLERPPVFGGQFDDPSDFGREMCFSGDLAGVDPTGIWHLDVVLPERWFPIVLRVDAGPTALLNGSPSSVSVTADDLFVRLEYVTGGGDMRLLAFDGCATDGDGGLIGPVAWCASGDCAVGTFWARRITRRPGEQVASGLELVAEHGGDGAGWDPSLTLNVRVAGDVAYLVRRADLRLIDVSDPAHPRDLGAAVDGTGADDYNDVKIVRGSDGAPYALVASASRGVVVLDVTDPAAPAEVATFPALGPDERVNVHTLFTETAGDQTRAYLANITTGGLDVYDVSDPRAPRRLGAYVHPAVETDGFAFVHDLYVADARVYLNYWGQGLVVVDARDPTAIAEVGQYGGYFRATNHSVWVTEAGGRAIAVMGDESFWAHVRIVDVDPDSPEFMTEIGAFETRPEVSVHNIMAFGDRAYVTYYQDGFRLLDLTDPTAPAEVAYYNTWEAATAAGESFYEGAIGVDVDLEAGLIYLADTARGLLIVRPRDVNR